MKDIRTFMAEHHAIVNETQMDGLCNTFIDEMSKELNNSASKHMLPAYINAEKELEVGKTVLAIDIGGTNLRVALVELGENYEPNILHIEKFPTPGRSSAVTTAEFFDLVAEYMSPVAEKASDIGLCFSFPCEILPNRDGKILVMTKEVTVTDASNKLIGEELKAALGRKNLKNDHNITVLNDTVAAMLCAKLTESGKEFDSYIGYIIGTGTNSCYSENNENVKKSEFLTAKSGKTIINTESGGFTCIPLGDIDRKFIDKTAAPTEYFVEKMISGAYQGPLALEYLKTAALEGCFAEDIADKISNLYELGAEDISVFLDASYSPSKLDIICGDNQEAKNAMIELFTFILDRAAAFTCASITAILEKTDTGRISDKPVCILADGSVIRYSGVFYQKLLNYVENYTVNQKNRHIEICFADNATLLGTAASAML